ncbi:hypothetical protein HYH38_16115 [Clostridium botulinum]|uniref:hypothetical protein n=1 Tax=Clostridium botulinum TaxID=1491 RepID=UPI00155DBD75|nr:hypothetical protein [Clostridium botulinum]MBY6810989.1 hypothetical protein [Clostridium botulinum]MBY6818466.1 hypothetical protein [Clostridium botulinum]MBY6824457.1 hypothetical protein [Clostridium botulinum]MBY6828760.1 hypothetical protein [Clostridium botulinum]MBY6832689.1 hypothetical protein [Clostridium botulinum]
MYDFIIGAIISLVVNIYLNPYLDILKNSWAKDGYSVAQINNAYYIYLFTITITLGLIVYGIRFLIKLIFNRNNVM